MQVDLLQHSRLDICAHAIRTCWQSFSKSDTDKETLGRIVCGEKDRELIDRVGNKFKHASTLEHLSYTFYISGVSRALLQELARHRMASLSVKSTRYTLKELKEEEPFYNARSPLEHLKGTEHEDCTMDDLRAEKYLVHTGDSDIDFASLLALENLRTLLASGKKTAYLKATKQNSH
jgi:thymidylate synthase (FAD)